MVAQLQLHLNRAERNLEFLVSYFVCCSLTGKETMIDESYDDNNSVFLFQSPTSPKILHVSDQRLKSHCDFGIFQILQMRREPFLFQESQNQIQ